jgi:branched-chain amino acid transport system substrate-binding protein
MKRLKVIILLLAVLLTLSWTSIIQADDIVIGFSGPLSGPAVEYGQDCFTGLDMAINELNAVGGITVDGKKLLFRLEKLDNKADPSMSVINARKLLSKNALVIYDTGLQQATLTKINQEECNEFIFMDYSASPKATKTGNKLQVVMNAPSTILCSALCRDGLGTWLAQGGHGCSSWSVR